MQHSRFLFLIEQVFSFIFQLKREVNYNFQLSMSRNLLQKVTKLVFVYLINFSEE